MTVREAAVRLGCSPAWIRERIRSGELRAVRVGRGWRVCEQSVAALALDNPAPRLALSPGEAAVAMLRSLDQQKLAAFREVLGVLNVAADALAQQEATP